ncbi:glycosyltransferase family 50 protein [Fomitiporia mediterranea MF3/22]|uniref:glycosyltransferase family 50 protein n=1 Tax=Fomitiporia mediterranea (strain MF3/22) TaxID=694068 RepID=UPI00044098F5|nr:glycosyltransferase family 50 protein [Fomitiporia mediterranea MF3/22]EJD02392.1 glycosyltransferase family 50 protein [Fomitiporia mediterranea MF3/22]
MVFSSLKNTSFKTVVLFSIVLRIALIFYSEWHDKHSVVKYTDVDYRVFTDAARFLLHPTISPYYRETYRYTPLLALIMTPNILLHPSFGKYLFSACDIIVGVLLYKLLLSTVLPRTMPEATNEQRERHATLYASLHLLNPMVFSISTRGSSESTLGALVIMTLYLAMIPRKTQRTWDATAVMLGAATHWKIYPLIYGVSIVAVMASESAKDSSINSWVQDLVSKRSIRFAITSAGTFMLLNGIMYLIWGYPFLYETYLYHIHRLDHKHNFSPYWLPIYLTHPAYAYLQPGQPALWQRFARSPFASFVPQMILSLGSGLVFGRAGSQHLPFTWFVQTAAFVTFNKVCTSQYFLWYLTILPLVLPSLAIARAKAIMMIAAWVGAQALWLKFAYDLEFLGKNVYYYVWICSILFLIVNCWELCQIMVAYQWRTAGEDKPTTSNESKKDI